jgi:dUTP pyrophosphatase
MPNYHSLVPVNFVKIHPDAQAPRYGNPNDLCFDLAACLPDGPMMVTNGGREKIPTGLKIEFPPQFGIFFWPRSGLADRHGIHILGGVIDAEYRGEYMIMLLNTDRQSVIVRHGDRIAQCYIAPRFQAVFTEKESLSESHRGEAGFGSSGR